MKYKEEDDAMCGLTPFPTKSAIGNQQSAITYTLGTGNRLSSWSATCTNNLFADVRGTSTETIGTDNRWGELWVSNLTAQAGTIPQTDGASFAANNIAMQMGTNQFVAAIRDQAGNMGYATNTVVYTVVTNATFLYNAAGCTTNISYTGTGNYSKSTALDWDERYRLVSVDDASSFVGYTYDVLNRKTTRIEGNDVEHYIYDGNQIVADVDENGSLLRTYIWGMGIDNLLSMTVYGSSSTNTYYPIKDHQNTVLALADENGTIVETYDYNAYGRTKVFSASGTELTASAYGNRYTFQGREIDWATGLIYFRARWYNPIVGRFISKDPIGVNGGMNLYMFCRNNSVNFVDSSGLCPENSGSSTLELSLSGTFFLISGEIHIGLGWNNSYSEGDFGVFLGASGGFGGGLGAAPAGTFGRDPDSLIEHGIYQYIDVNGAGSWVTGGARINGSLENGNDSPAFYGGVQLPSEGSAHLTTGPEISITVNGFADYLESGGVPPLNPLCFGNYLDL